MAKEHISLWFLQGSSEICLKVWVFKSVCFVCEAIVGIGCIKIYVKCYKKKLWWNYPVKIKVYIFEKYHATKVNKRDKFWSFKDEQRYHSSLFEVSSHWPSPTETLASTIASMSGTNTFEFFKICKSDRSGRYDRNYMQLLRVITV